MKFSSQKSFITGVTLTIAGFLICGVGMVLGMLSAPDGLNNASPIETEVMATSVGITIRSVEVGLVLGVVGAIFLIASFSQWMVRRFSESSQPK